MITLLHVAIRAPAHFNALRIQFRGHIDFGVREQDPCGIRLEIPFTWWRDTVK